MSSFWTEPWQGLTIGDGDDADVSEQFDGPPRRDGRPGGDKTRRIFAGRASAVIAE